MYNYRISKYNPIYRDNEGRYKLDEWTSFSDIGSIYENSEFTIDEYLIVEDIYVDAITLFMKCLDISLLKVHELEKNEMNLEVGKFYEVYSDEMKSLYNSLQDGIVLRTSDMENLVRLVLREKLWCKLEYNDTMFVHFGYDYYMYIGSSKKCEETTKKIMRLGLFIEDFKSPYID